MITAYLKPTNYCNINCTHCYLPLSVRADKTKMTREVLVNVMKFLSEMQKKANHDKVCIIWHGGEPLILPPDYYLIAGENIDSFFHNMVVESMQSSLIPYKKNFVQLIKTRWGGQIGSSIDFNSRFIKGSFEKYQKLWLKKVDLAREDDILIIPTMVPNKIDCTEPVEIFHWFIQHGFWIWTIDRHSNFGETSVDFSTNREHANFLIGLFNESIKLIKNGRNVPLIRTIGAAISGVLYELPGDRWGGTCQSDFVVFNPDGRLNNCPDKDSFEGSYGHLNGGFKSFKSYSMRRKWVRIQQAGHRINECYYCENSTWCKSGRPITGNACITNGQKDECSGFKSFINRIRSFINTDTDGIDILKKYLNFDFVPKNQSKSIIMPSGN